ncbi:helix-turn-helix transcriptional regulator [Desulfogranum marinum]|uniref:helix-turn-helix transcriptional regulator n=1 Tax=Desulfogranum marinum TaxID=453220 RepID=UPI0019660262|nr:helix-turn-helix transcriptional regulator [Desulfogranum marinum]MBM9514301.1 helix-turn-helix transcriptional regulator [Desulfogranum marinum]
MSKLMTTREVAAFLNVNEKMIYTLVADKELPATKVTGKWLFPQHLVEQWVDNNTTNFPKQAGQLPAGKGVIILAGSNDLLLDQVIAMFNASMKGCLAVFANVGSMGGIHALRQGLCHIASSHLVQDDDSDYNFQFAFEELKAMPVVVNFCKRQQGLLFKKDNPLGIHEVADLGRKGVRLVNRPLGTGTRLLLDNELKKRNMAGEKISGYDYEVAKHLDVGLEILAGRADVGPGIEAVAGALDLGFLPLRWERFDFLISRHLFFEKPIQHFLGLLEQDEFQKAVTQKVGYDINLSGKMVFQVDG